VAEKQRRGHVTLKFVKKKTKNFFLEDEGNEIRPGRDEEWIFSVLPSFDGGCAGS